MNQKQILMDELPYEVKALALHLVGIYSCAVNFEEDKKRRAAADSEISYVILDLIEVLRTHLNGNELIFDNLQTYSVIDWHKAKINADSMPKTLTDLDALVIEHLFGETAHEE